MSIGVGFDLDHTLAIDNKLERTVAMSLLADRAAAASLPLDREFAQRETEAALAAYRRGDVTFYVAWSSLYEKVLGPGDEPQAFVDEFAERCVLAVPKHVEVLPGAHDLLAALEERKIRYALLTNGWSPLQEAKAEAIRFQSTVLVSERIGARKPHAAAFDRLAAALDVPPSNLFYVGDDARTDVAASQAAGLTGVWYDWESNAYPTDCEPPNHTIHALIDLLRLL